MLNSRKSFDLVMGAKTFARVDRSRVECGGGGAAAELLKALHKTDVFVVSVAIYRLPTISATLIIRIFGIIIIF